MSTATVRSLGKHFATTTLRTRAGRTLRVVSDGCAGNGSTHWRAVYVPARTRFNWRLVAAITTSRGSTGATVTLANARGSLRGGRELDFASLRGAALHPWDTL